MSTTKFAEREIWCAAKVVPPKYLFSYTKQVILDVTFLVTGIVVLLREIKKILHLLCIASPANNFHCQNKCENFLRAVRKVN